MFTYNIDYNHICTPDWFYELYRIGFIRFFNPIGISPTLMIDSLLSLVLGSCCDDSLTATTVAGCGDSSWEYSDNTCDGRHNRSNPSNDV